MVTGDILFVVALNLRSYPPSPPSLHLIPGKEGVIHLLVGSHVQKPDSGFFLIGRDTILMIHCVLIGCHISIKLPVRKKQNGGDEVSLLQG